MDFEQIGYFFGSENVQLTGSQYFGNSTTRSDVDIVVLVPVAYDRQLIFSHVADAISNGYEKVRCTPTRYEFTDGSGQYAYTLTDDFDYDHELDIHSVFTLTGDDFVDIHLIVVTTQFEFDLWTFLSNVFRDNLNRWDLYSVGYRNLFAGLRHYLTATCRNTDCSFVAAYEDLAVVTQNVLPQLEVK